MASRVHAEETIQFFPTLTKSKPSAGRPRHNDELKVVIHEFSIGAIGFSDVAFHPVSHRGGADRSRDSHSHLAPVIGPPDLVANKVVSHALGSRFKYAFEIAFARQPLAPWECFQARHSRFVASNFLVRVMESIELLDCCTVTPKKGNGPRRTSCGGRVTAAANGPLYRKAFASSPATALNDVAPSNGRHAASKSVRALSLHGGWLIGAFHGLLLKRIGIKKLPSGQIESGQPDGYTTRGYAT